MSRDGAKKNAVLERKHEDQNPKQGHWLRHAYAYIHFHERERKIDI